MTIETEQLRNMYLSTDVVTSVSVINEVQEGSNAIVNSAGIFNALSSLSAEVIKKANADPKKEIKTFDFSETPSISIDNVPNTRILVDPLSGTISSVTGYDAGSQFFRIPSIIKTNSGRRVVIFDVRWNSTQDIGRTAYNDQCIGMIYSDDDGDTWSHPKSIINWFYPDYDPSDLTKTYQSGVSDPGILYDEDNDVIMVFALGGYGYAGRWPAILSGDTPYSELSSSDYQQLVFTYSKDNGETWSTPSAVTNRIFDVNGTTQEWARTYRYCFSTCTAGITLRRQSNNANNGIMLFPVQLAPEGFKYDTFYSNLRIALLKVIPTYDSSKNITDIKLVFDQDESGNLNTIGATSGGANEGSVCEGPNGELVFAARTYNRIMNETYGLIPSQCVISTKIYKSLGLSRNWEVIGDETHDTDKICTHLETTCFGGTKPAISWSKDLNIYIIGYVQALKDPYGGDLRTNLILRYSSDLIDWKYLSSLEFKQGQGYITIVPQYDSKKLVEFIYEGYVDSPNYTANNGSSKQLKYGSISLLGKVPNLFSSLPIDQACIWSSNTSIQGFSFNISEAHTTLIYPSKTYINTALSFPQLLVSQSISKLTILWGNFTSTQHSIYCGIYDADNNNAVLLAKSSAMNLSTNEQFPNYKVEFEFNQPVLIDPTHTYFIKFSLGSEPPNIRGALGAYGNVVSVTTLCSRHNTQNYMKVYQQGSPLIGANYPLAVWFQLS